jgi:Uncharacterized protein conserved in bacteria (DUF2130)
MKMEAISVTTIDAIQNTGRCPVCGSDGDLTHLSRSGLSQMELDILSEHIKNGTLGDRLTLAEIVLRRLDPEKTSMEFQVNDAISKVREVAHNTMHTFMNEAEDFLRKLSIEKEEDKIKIIKEYEQEYKPLFESLEKEFSNSTKNFERMQEINRQQYSETNQSVREIKEKIVGTGIGNVSEIAIIRDLKEVTPIDFFSEERSCKGGTDIVGTVKERGAICGKITISSKNTQKWESQFMSQLCRDMNDDGSRFGILVTKAFPREALSNKAYALDTQEGKTVLVVKPEYAPFAYFGLRQAVIHWFETRNIMKKKEEEVLEEEKVFNALVNWINGDDFEECIRHIDNARKAAEDTRNTLSSMRNYINNHIDNANESQNSIQQDLQHAEVAVVKLRSLLNSGPS